MRDFIEDFVEKCRSDYNIDDLRKEAGLAAPRIDLAPPERRHRSFVVSPEAIINLFRMPRSDEQYIYLARLLDVPDGYEIPFVNFSPDRGGLVFIVSHPSFDVVPDGEYPPMCLVRCEMVELARESEKPTPEVRQNFDVEKWSNLP